MYTVLYKNKAVPVSYTHLDVYKRQVLHTDIFSMVNDNSRKFKQNQMMFCIQSCIVEFSIPIGVGEDRLRERGSLPATVFIKGNFYFHIP